MASVEVGLGAVEKATGFVLFQHSPHLIKGFLYGGSLCIASTRGYTEK